ncbi:hypothetical protein LINGRAPRIM_LOCUS2711, partial [Linum grandiflorum]
KKGQLFSSQSRSYVAWNDAIDEVLTQVLLDQANNGNKGDGDWKVQAIQAVLDEIRILLATTVTKGNVKNMLRKWKQHYGMINDIQNRSGVSLWDEEKKKVVITTENASDWEDYLKIRYCWSLHLFSFLLVWDSLLVEWHF